jgi:predicted Zn-dependent protease
MRFPRALVCLLGVAAGVGFAQDSNRNKKDDPAQIGNRDVGKGVNLYSLEKEIALGKQLAQEVQRQAKVVDDPLISEYINRIGQIWSQPRCKSAVHVPGD